METEPRRRVVLRSGGKRQHLEVTGGQTARGSSKSSHSTAHVLSNSTTTAHYSHSLQNTASHPNLSAAELPAGSLSPHSSPPRIVLDSSSIFHSTPLHPPLRRERGDQTQAQWPRFPSLSDASSSSSSSSSSLEANREQSLAGSVQMATGLNAPQHSGTWPRSWAASAGLPQGRQDSEATESKGQGSRNQKIAGQKKVQKKNRDHPVAQTPVPSHGSAWSPPSKGHSTGSSSSLNSSLPPLLCSQLRKGGQRPSPSVDWSRDAVAELTQLLPDQHLRVFVVTWNMQQMKELPDSLDNLLLPLSHVLAADLYVMGTQESTGHRREWEVLLQQTLGPTHVLVHSVSLGVLCLVMFLRRDLIWYCSAVESAGHATRPVTMIKTKGGLGLSFTLFGSSFIFITSHLTAHTQKVVERNMDMRKIADNLTTGGLSEFDYVFWFGDLNYRVEMERERVDQFLQHHNWMPLLLHDQLTKEILKGNAFQGFSEQPIQFPPSYKFDLNSTKYDSSEKKRTPSWTDRILFHSRSGSGITGCGYDSCGTLRNSDHRPVCGVFRVRLEPCRETDGIPDTVAIFDRDIYRIAHQRRKEVAHLSLSMREVTDGPVSIPHTSKNVTSTICTVL